MRFREAMADLFSDLKEEKSPAVLAGLPGAGFLYGILHALDPGHRKTVMFSLFAARKARWYEPLAAGFLSALLHGMSAVFVTSPFPCGCPPHSSSACPDCFYQSVGIDEVVTLCNTHLP